MENNYGCFPKEEKSKTEVIKSLNGINIIKDTKIDFMGHARAAIFLSTVLILIGIGSMVTKGGPKLSIDFKGGTLIEVRTQNSDISELRKILSNSYI